MSSAFSDKVGNGEGTTITAQHGLARRWTTGNARTVRDSILFSLAAPSQRARYIQAGETAG